jgi:WD40 repeat protein/serine/threonine protein kinase
MAEGQPRGAALSRHAWVGLERLIDRFEDAWQTGQQPAIDDYLPTDEAQRQAVLIELVHADLERRLQAGEAVRVEAYLDRYPELAGDRDAVLQFIAAEYELRRETEPRLSPVEFHGRFPDFAAELPLCLQNHWSRAGDTPHPTEALDAVATTRVGLLPAGDAALPTVPGYEITEEIGRGGMGVVYKARQQGLNRWVALKMVLAGAHAGRTERERFRAEAEAAARLQHPNIVQVHDVGEHEGRPYLALEYVPGGSLAQHLSGQPLSARSAALMVETLARAMHYAHQQGVIHRDLKPANILVSGGVVSGEWSAAPTTHHALLATDQIKITDFGLAKQLGAGAELTCSGAILGTPSYIAPEQVEGRAKRVGPGADVYALGAILYEMLTGRPPFQGATPLETLEQVRVQEPVAPRRLQPKVPHDLEVICIKCLEKEPRRRYASAADLADDLKRFLDGVPIRARPVSTTEHLVKWVRRRPAVAMLTASVVAVALAGVGGLAWQVRQTHAGLAKAEDNLYANRIALADREWLAGHVDHAEQLLAECPPGRRGWEWHYLRRLCHRDQRTLRADGAFGVGLAGRFLAVAAADEEAVVVWDLEAGQRVLTLPQTGLGLAISPDGKRLASATWKIGPGGELLAEQACDVIVWEIPGGREVLRLPGHRGTVFSLCFSPDGKGLASASLDGTVKIWDLAAEREVRTYRRHAGWVEAVAFGPQGLLASAGADGTVRIWNATSGAEQLVLTDDKSPAGRLAKGRVLSSKGDTRPPAGNGGMDQPLKVWDPESGRTIVPLRGQTNALASVAFSPDGSRIAAGQGNVVRVWETAGGREVHALRGHNDLVRDVAFDGSGTRLASASYDQTLKVWDLATGEEVTTLRGHTAPVNRVAFGRDGRQLVSASWDGTVKVWDVVTSGEVLVVRGHADFARGLAFAPDGMRLATAGADRQVFVCNAWTGKQDLCFAAHADTANAVAFSSDGTRLATAGYDGTVRLWDATTGAAIHTFTGHKGLVYRVAFSPDGSQLASAGHDGTVRFWDVGSGAERLVLRGHAGRVFAVVFHPNGRQVASAGDDRTVRLWDTETMAALRTLEGHSNDVTGVAFSRDGRRLASSSLDRTAKVWDVTTGEELLTLHGHVNGVTAVAFSGDGQRLATASLDRGVRLWNAANGEELLALRGPMLEVLGVTFSPDGNRLAAATAEGAAYIWDATPLPD